MKSGKKKKELKDKVLGLINKQSDQICYCSWGFVEMQYLIREKKGLTDIAI